MLQGSHSKSLPVEPTEHDNKALYYLNLEIP